MRGIRREIKRARESEQRSYLEGTGAGSIGSQFSLGSG
jgi:hypothetical protein